MFVPDGTTLRLPLAKCTWLCANSVRTEGLTQGIQVKVGAHYGEVIEEDGDIFGDAVNVAARMASLAKADQILVTKLSLRNCQRSFVRLCVITIRSNSKVKCSRLRSTKSIWEVSGHDRRGELDPTIERVKHSRSFSAVTRTGHAWVPRA